MKEKILLCLQVGGANCRIFFVSEEPSGISLCSWKKEEGHTSPQPLGLSRYVPGFKLNAVAPENPAGF